MNKKKILFCSESSWLSTCYSFYTKEVLSRLVEVEDIEVAEIIDSLPEVEEDLPPRSEVSEKDKTIEEKKSIRFLKFHFFQALGGVRSCSPELRSTESRSYSL